jgi:putative transposase
VRQEGWQQETGYAWGAPYQQWEREASGHAFGIEIDFFQIMPNHFHLLIKEIEEGGITEFMRKLCTAYSSFFNKVHQRSGTLFQGRFKAQHANSDIYLKYLFSYIHLNPVKLIEPKWKELGISNPERVRSYINDFPFSSYQDYAGKKREENIILNPESFPDYFSSEKDFQSHIEDFLNYKDFKNEDGN